MALLARERCMAHASTEGAHPMMTRKQVEAMIPLTNMDAQTVNLGAGEGFVGVYTALWLMIDHDAALRTELAAMREECEKWKLATSQVARSHEDYEADLQRQLAYMTKERDLLSASLAERVNDLCETQAVIKIHEGKYD